MTQHYMKYKAKVKTKCFSINYLCPRSLSLWPFSW